MDTNNQTKPTKDRFADLPANVQKIINERLEPATKIFHRADQNQQGFLTATEVGLLLIETYKQMGIDYQPAEEDIKMWMDVADTDKDGKVYLADYEDMIINSLKQQGVIQD